MPTKRKDHLDKAAWVWAETVDPGDVSNIHLEAAYRIKLKACKPGSCRRTCRGNPHCLSGIGERSWLGDIADETWHKGEDPDAERRSGNSFVGLRNLGATCYVNSLLQLWFHNLSFRKAVYLWKPKAISFDGKTEEAIGAVSSISHLQCLFALLQFGPRKYLDPTEFVLSLGLDTMTQQDAQEFSKLFLTMLEEQLAAPNQLPEVRDMVRSQFLGEYDYVTRCLHCGTESACPSTFYELDLNISRSGNNSGDEESSGEKQSPPRSSLAEFLQEFLHEEKLEGADRYHCAVCGCKQDATRSIKLRRLPPVLTLQLLRFVFDRNTGHKKKLNSFVYFPEELDMAPYLGPSVKPSNYSLRAVLAHKGSSAYSGHYVAHICDATSGGWYRFNDESVEKMEGKKLQLGYDEDVLDPKKKKRPRTPKGQLSSNNAYMLVYVKVDASEAGETKGKTVSSSKDQAMTLEQLPSHLFDIVQKEKENFEDWVSTQKQSRDLIVQSGKERQAEIRSIYDILPVNLSDGVIKEDVNWDFLSVDWLIKWLDENDDDSKDKGSDFKKIPMVDHASLLCPHGRLKPDAVTDTKCISTIAADTIYEKYGGGPRLRGRESMCRECVTSRCKSIRLRAKTAQDAQTITTLLKSCGEGTETGYWIGKASLRSWRRMALEERDDEEGNEADNGGMGDGDGNHVGSGEPTVTGKEISCNGSGETGVKDEELTLGFNCDIVCTHGNLCPKDNNRRIVPEAVWSILKGYFPGAPEYLSSVEKCSKCEDMANEGQALKNQFRQIASAQRETLSDLYLEKNRPSMDTLNFESARIIPREFLIEWRRFIREPNKRPHPMSLNCEDLICPHGGLRYDPCSRLAECTPKETKQDDISLNVPSVDVEADSRVALIWEYEWTVLKEFYSVNKEIIVTVETDETEPVEIAAKPEKEPEEEPMEVVQEETAPSEADVVPTEVAPVDEVSSARVPDAFADAGSGDHKESESAEATSTSVPDAAPVQGLEKTADAKTVNGKSSRIVKIDPSPCVICVRERLCRARESLLHYARAKVFIRKVSTSAEAAAVPVKEDEDDPEFKATEAKRPRGKTANGAASLHASAPPSALAGEVRRSTRHRRIRGEEELVVSSDSTLRDLKVKIMRIFGVAPFDQHLSLGGRPLIDHHATLSDLRVYPGSVITLKADEPWEDPMLLGDFDKDAAPEEGFKGTGLLSS